MRMYLDSVGLTGVNACKYVVSFLKGDALTWWRQYCLTHGGLGNVYNDLTVDDIFDELTQQFTDVEKQMYIRKQLFAIRQTTSVQAYTTRFRHLMCELTSPLDDETALHVYMQGLKEHIGVQVHLRKPTSLEDMIVLAERVDQAMMVYRRSGFGGIGGRPNAGQQMGMGAPRGGHTHGRSGGQRVDQQFRGQRGGFGVGSFGVGRHVFGVGRGGGNVGRGGVHFGNVSQYGNHNYRGPAPMVLGAVQDLVCYQCGQPGHIRRNCPQVTGQARGNGNARGGAGRGARGNGRMANHRGQQWANVLQSTGIEVTEELHNILQFGSAAVDNQQQQREQQRVDQASGSGAQSSSDVVFDVQQEN